MSRALHVVLLALVLGAAAAPVLAVQPDEILDDPALEARAREISSELRCLVCQNQSIDDSNAPLARDLRVLVRERLEAGDSDQEVVDFIVARYGEFVLLRPRFGAHTLVLWLAPVVLVVIGGIVLASAARKKRATSAPPLTDDEKRRLEAALGPGDGG